MFRKNQIETLIEKHSRRLQKLHEKRALKGVDTTADVLIEIEDLESEIEKLQAELSSLTQSNSSENDLAVSNYKVPTLLKFLIVIVISITLIGIMAMFIYTERPTATVENTSIPKVSDELVTVVPTEENITTTNRFMWLGEALEEDDFYQTGEVTYTIQNDGINITGRFVDDILWIDKELPDNFRVTVEVTNLDTECYFSVGFGLGDKRRSSYYLQIRDENYGFRKHLDQEEHWNYLIDSGIADSLEINQPNEVILERNNNVIRVRNKDRLVFPPIRQGRDPKLDEFNGYSVLFFQAGYPGKACKMIINSFIVEPLD
ncbi:MAG: hypothetical protein KDI79_17320 [Anaerolineae bacterium]|nr:hypothetical protein [Anaerolineae bacterium]